MSTHLDNTYGAAFIGMVVAAVLYGVSCLQAFYYYTHQNDTWHNKLTVTAAMIFDTVHQALITHAVYTYTITDWGNVEQLQLMVWSLLVEVLFTALTALIVQSFLTMRIWRLSNRNIYITGACAVLVVAGFVSTIVYFFKALRFKTLASLATVEGESMAVNVFGAAADILIAATLCTILHVSRSRVHKFDAMINKLIIFSVNTGLLTSLCALGSLISTIAAGKTFIYVPFYFCLGRVYTNSLLATLNARKIIRGSSVTTRLGESISVSLAAPPKSPSGQVNM